LKGSGGSADLRAAVIGYGLAGETLHTPLISAVPGIEVAAIVTRDEARRRRAAQRSPDAALFEDAAEIWEDADRFDVAVVAAPNRAHVPLASAALEAGLAVVVDKPLARSAEEARELVESAERRDLMLFSFQNRRWDGDLLTVRKLIEEGELGEIRRMESRFERWRPELSAGWREQADPEEAGGLLYDLGSHLVDQALHLFGHARHVYAELDVRRPGAKVDDDSFVALTHESEVRSHLWMSVVAAQRGPRLRFLDETHGLRQIRARPPGAGVSRGKGSERARVGSRGAGPLGPARSQWRDPGSGDRAGHLSALLRRSRGLNPGRRSAPGRARGGNRCPRRPRRRPGLGTGREAGRTGIDGLSARARRPSPARGPSRPASRPASPSPCIASRSRRPASCRRSCGRRGRRGSPPAPSWRT
jgi:scyllo-inositol 2-dehydrogenase (NADP+)